MTSQHWRSPLSAFLNDLKFSDQITSILPLLDIFIVKANTKRSVVMLRVSSRCTPRVAHHVNRQTEDFSASWNSFLMYKGPRKSITTCLSCGDGVTRPSGRGVILCTRVVVLKYRQMRHWFTNLFTAPLPCEEELQVILFHRESLTCEFFRQLWLTPSHSPDTGVDPGFYMSDLYQLN